MFLQINLQKHTLMAIRSERVTRANWLDLTVKQLHQTVNVNLKLPPRPDLQITRYLILHLNVISPKITCIVSPLVNSVFEPLDGIISQLSHNYDALRGHQRPVGTYVSKA